MQGRRDHRGADVVAGELAIGELAAIPAGDLAVKVGLGRVDPGPPLSVTVAREWVSEKRF